MNTAWTQGGPGINFNGIKQSEFQADIQTPAAFE
jgi:hypothetical protein